MEQTEQSSFLVRESLGKLMLKYSVPCVISLLVAALYNIVDQIFIANASYLLNGRFRPFDFVCIRCCHNFGI